MSVVEQLPDFVIIGAAKSATSSMYNYLREHKDVFMPDIKETNYFAYSDDINETKFLGNYQVTKFHAKTLEEYKLHFANVNGAKILGEASPVYLSSPIAANKIKALIPEVKIIASLRNPVDRALSSYIMHCRLGRESRTPNEAFANLNKEAYVLAGQYYPLMQRYYELFDEEKIQVLLFEDLKLKPVEKMQEVYRFIGADDRFEPCTDKVHNKGGVASGSLAKIVGASVKTVSNSLLGEAVKNILPRDLKRQLRGSIESCYLKYPEFDDVLVQRLTDFYEKDNENLAQLTGLDISVWSK